MLRVLARCDPMDVLYSTLIDALESLGPPVLEPALAAHAAAESEDQRAAIASVLSGVGVRDDRILAILLKSLEDDVELAPARSPSMAIRPHCPTSARPSTDASWIPGAVCSRIRTSSRPLEAAIEAVGGVLSEDQSRKVRLVEAARDEARAPLLATGASDDDEEDDGDDRERNSSRPNEKRSSVAFPSPRMPAAVRICLDLTSRSGTGPITRASRFRTSTLESCVRSCSSSSRAR